MDIYTYTYEIKPLRQPTRLQILRHKKTGMKYLSKSFKQDKELESYFGSGTAWLRHLANHGKDVERLWVSDWFYDTTITKFAMRFSRFNRIVESNEWANQKPENGIDGGTRETAMENLKKAVEANTGKKRPEHSEFMKKKNAERRENLTKCHTPYGVFQGIHEVIRNTPAKDFNTVKSYLDGKVLTKQMVGSHLRFCKNDPLFTYNDVGKNTNDIGWYWIK